MTKYFDMGANMPKMPDIKVNIDFDLEEDVATIRNRIQELFSRATENVNERVGVQDSESPPWSEISGVPVDHDGRPRHDWQNLINLNETPTTTLEKIGEGFQVFAEQMSELAAHIDELNKRLSLVESLLTLGEDGDPLRNKDKIASLVKEAKRQLDIYIEEELDAHLISRKIRWKARCNRDD